MAQPMPVEGRGVFTRRLFLRPLLLLAAFIVLTGAGVAAAGLLQQVFDSSGMPGWRTAWDRAERLDLKQTDMGVTITLERAYADLNQILVGFTVEGLEEPAGDRVVEWDADLRDPSGRSWTEWAPSGTGTGLEQAGLSAVLMTWVGPVDPAAGTWRLTFTSVGYDGFGFVPGACTVGATDPECASPPPRSWIDGNWQFEFELPAPGGTVLYPGISDTQAQATLTITQLRITPTMVSATIGLRLTDGSVADWTPKLTIRRDESQFYSNGAVHLTLDPADQGRFGDENAFYTTAGSDLAAGTWVIEISELTYRSGDDQAIEHETRLTGPWTLSVTVP